MNDTQSQNLIPEESPADSVQYPQPDLGQSLTSTSLWFQQRCPSRPLTPQSNQGQAKMAKELIGV